MYRIIWPSNKPTWKESEHKSLLSSCHATSMSLPWWFTIFELSKKCYTWPCSDWWTIMNDSDVSLFKQLVFKIDTKNLTRYCYSKTCNRQLFLWWCIMRQVVFLPTTHRELQILSHFSAAACTLIAIVTRPLWRYEHAWKRVLIHWTLWMSTIFMCSNYSRHWPNFLVSIKGNTVYTLTWLRPLV